MRTRYFATACLAVLAMALLATVAISAPPQDFNSAAYARDYVRDLLVVLDQWTKSIPQAYDQAMLKPPIDASKLSPEAKGGADGLRDTITQMAAMKDLPDLTTNAQFKALAQKAMAQAIAVNAALGNQMRWPADLQSDWNDVRINLNYMARVYGLDTLADFSPAPAGRGGRGGGGGRRGPAPGAPGAAAASAAALTLQGTITTETVVGYIVDQSCAGRRGMWQNANCIETCIKGGDRPVVVTEDGKVYQISNLDKITPAIYGKSMSLTGKTDGEVLVVDALKPAE